MAAYTAPLADMQFIIHDVLGLADITALPGCEEVTPDLVDAVLEEAGKFGAEVLAPINRIGDIEGCTLENGVVRSPDGFREAYAQFVEGGWNSVPFEPEFGGQDLPWLIATTVSEIWDSANLAFSLCSLLTQGAIESLTAHGSDQQKATFLPNLVSGVWSGTMNLTEPQAGSDLSRIKAKAVPDGDAYRITGQKIFITYGETDFTENIIHLVLARTPDAPAGVKGISLFIVPKFLVNDDGSLGTRNDLRCVSLEHKLGIHASPTAVMSFGDDGGATGILVGEENRGLEYMFTMMNNARLSVGLEGVAIAERAYQQARDYALDRVQGRAMGSTDPDPVTIIHHPDVRRMLLSMKAQTEAARSLAYYVASCMDFAKRHPDETVRRDRQMMVDLLIPVVKAWSSDIGIDVASTGIQVHGGMGYIEETGAAQHLRDARIAAIYEGTNGIHAMDLISRKVGRDGGTAMRTLIKTIRRDCADLSHGDSADLSHGDSADLSHGDSADLSHGDGKDLAVIQTRLEEAVGALEKATDWLVETYPENPQMVAAGAVPYLRLSGIVGGGWMMARAALIAAQKLQSEDGPDSFLRAKVISARFFADHILVESNGLLSAFVSGAESVLALEENQF